MQKGFKWRHRLHTEILVLIIKPDPLYCFWPSTPNTMHCVIIIGACLELTPCLLLAALGRSIPPKLFPGKLWQRFSVAVPAAGPSSSCGHLLSRPLRQPPR